MAKARVYQCVKCQSKYAISFYDMDSRTCKCCILTQANAALREEYSTMRDVNSMILQGNTKIADTNKYLKEDNKDLKADNRNLRESMEELKKQVIVLLNMQAASPCKAALKATKTLPTTTAVPPTAVAGAIPGTSTSLQESLHRYTKEQHNIQQPRTQAQPSRRQQQPIINNNKKKQQHTRELQQRKLGTTSWRTIKGKRIIPTKPVAVALKNKYSGLHDLELRPHTYLVGDSIIKHQSSEFKWYDQKKRSVLCRPGATIHRVTENIKELKCDRKDTIITHCGTNNIKCKRNGLPEAGVFRSEDLIGRYRTMIKELRKKTDSAIITSILPRKYVSNCISSRIHYINRAVSKIAVEEGLHYLDLTSEFKHGSLYSPDGLHLNFWGKRKLGELLDRAVSEWSNQQQGNGHHREQQQGNGHHREQAPPEDCHHRIPGNKT
jgi:mannose/fructose-specific phosphotransferase system component IIA